MTQEETKALGYGRPQSDASGSSAARVPFRGESASDSRVIDLRSGEPIVHGRIFTPVGGGLLVAPPWKRAAKRLVDIVGASLALIVLLPLMLLASLAVAITSPGPVLFVQERVGRGGRSFRMLKFRSMVRDAEAQRDALESLNVHVSGPIFKIRDDPRITPVGRVMRLLSIDELPQLLNVLGGSMSLVGPRPPLPIEVRTYDDWEAQRLLAKPGITCIWQVSGRSELDFETWVRLDLEYLETWSLWLDFRLLARTIPAVVSRRGAC
jgi:lipopolysaccharide/colanic/teichoic acid biosynthesis glycosyltransferase